jgi:simple sugar transport system ATP-binding protein
MIGRDLADPPPARRPVGPDGADAAAGATGSAGTGREVLRVRGLTVRDADGLARLSDVSLTVRAGEVVGIAGVAGSGQRELVDSLTGLRTDATGAVLLDGTDLAGVSVRRRRRLGIGYVPEDRHGRGTAASMTVADNLVMGEEDRPPLRRAVGRLSRSAVVARAKRLVGQFDVRTSSVAAPLASLSGGNAQKAVLARELSRDVSLVVVEEPTQGVDVGAQEYIHGLLRAARDEGRGVLLVSSELSELRALADRLLVMFGGRVVTELPVEATDDALGAAMTGVVAAETHR